MSETMMNPGNNDGHLGGTSSTNSFILGVSSKDDNRQLSAATICFHYLYSKSVSLICQSVIFQVTDKTVGTLVTA